MYREMGVGDQDDISAVVPSRPATSVDVARLAGVSRATVSYVLNNRGARFSDATAERVRRAAAALGYVRSAAGRALVNGRSDFIVVVVPYATFIRLQEIIEALTSEISQLGLCMIAHFSGPSDDRGQSERLRHLVETLRPAGVINLGGISPQDRAAIEALGCPVLPNEISPDVNGRIGELQAEYLHSRGYRRLAYAFLSDAREDPYGQSRAGAVRKFCTSQGLPPMETVHVPVEPAGATSSLEDLLARTGTPIAIACYNDKVALSLVFAAKRCGLAVPGDVAVIGLEAADVGQVVTPRLTTVVGDVTALVHSYQLSLAETFDDSAPVWEDLPLAETFMVLSGETA